MALAVLLSMLSTLSMLSLPLSAQRQNRRLHSRPPAAPARVAPAPARVERPVPFTVGETLAYDVSWSTYLTAGTALMTVKEKKPSYNSTAYYIVAEGRPTPLVGKLYPLYYKLDTLLDVYTLLPQRGSIYSEEGSRHRFRTTAFDRTAKKASFEYRTTTTVKADFAVPPYVQDALSAIYVLRALPLKSGDRVTLPVSDDGVNYQVRVEVSGPERVKTPSGETGAWKLTLTISDEKNQQVGKNLSIWLGDDARRRPMKLQADLAVGSFVLTLRDAR